MTMTYEEVVAKRETISSNDLFKQSTSVYKDKQYLSWHEGEDEDSPLMVGFHTCVKEIDGNEELYLLNFDKDGFLHGGMKDGSVPAVEGREHIEYWNHGVIVKVKDEPSNTTEYWENGIPVRIEEGV